MGGVEGVSDLLDGDRVEPHFEVVGEVGGAEVLQDDVVHAGAVAQLVVAMVAEIALLEL